MLKFGYNQISCIKSSKISVITEKIGGIANPARRTFAAQCRVAFQKAAIFKFQSFKIYLIFAPLGIVQTSLTLRLLVAKIQNFKLFLKIAAAIFVSSFLRFALFLCFRLSVAERLRVLFIGFPTPPLRSSPCKGDRFAPKLVQSSPLFKGSTCASRGGVSIQL